MEISTEREQQLDLERLQRLYHGMLDEKKLYFEETENNIRRQKKCIAALLEEERELMAGFKVATSHYYDNFDEKNTCVLRNLMNEEDALMIEIAAGKKHILLLDKEIAKIEQKITQQRKRTGGVLLGELKNVSEEKHKRVLKNRLYVGNVKLNEALTRNKALREQIDHIYSQKHRYEDLCKKLKKIYEERKMEIDRLTEAAIGCFQSRYEAQHKMQSLKERSDRDLSCYNVDMKEFRRVIDHERKLREFMGIKIEERTDILENEILKRYLKRQANQSKLLKHEVEKYEKIFTELKRVSGIDDTDELVQTFITVEDQNFALFNYVTEITNQIAVLHSEIVYYTVEIDKMGQECDQQHGANKNLVTLIEKKLQQVLSEHSHAIQREKKEKKSLTVILPRIEEMFDKIGCSRKIISEVLGSGENITSLNAMQFLGIIECRCSEFLQVKSVESLTDAVAAEKDKEVEPPKVDGMLGQGPLVPLANFTIQPPNISDEDTFYNDELKPFTLIELQEMISKEMT